MPLKPLIRREFLRQATSASAAMVSAMVLGRQIAGAPFRDAGERLGHSISVFTKPFNSLSYDQLAAAIKQLGVDGIEAPVRRGGHVAMDQLATELPRLVSALEKHELKLTIMASDINTSTDESSVEVLKTAAANGVDRYRLKYFRYQAGKSIAQQVANWKAQLKDLAALNQELGIQGLYQNHAGKQYFGAAIWDLANALDGIDPQHLGVAYDIRHATVEGGLSWPTTLRRILPHVQMLYVKDFRWEGTKVVNVPLGTGNVDSTFLQTFKESGFDGPISLHEEYLDHADPKLVPKHLEAMQRDLTVLRKWLA